MADYNFILAKQIINSTTNLQSASLGMHEDWFWTAETICKKESGYLLDLNEKTKIAGIQGSSWATPVLQLEFEDGSEKTINCFKGIVKSDLEKIEKEMFFASGCLSEPVQRYRDSIEVKEYGKEN